MPKDIAVVSYNLNPASSLTKDAVMIRDILNNAGYSAELVHQWAFNEPNSSYFKQEKDWDKYDGVIICYFYTAWNLRELIKAGRPLICANVGYADDLGLGDRQHEHMSEDDFNVVNSSHPIITGAGLGAGTFDIGDPIWMDSVSEHNHHVDVLVRTLGNRAALLVHKEYPFAYWGWYRMSQATNDPILKELLVSTANFIFSGP